MPNFKQFIKGFEEPEQPKENRDQIIEKVNRKMMNAGTYGALGDKENYEKSIAEAEGLRKGLAPKGEPKPQPKPEEEGKYFKDAEGEIYLKKGGQDFYPVGEKERSDFFNAFNKQERPKPQPKPGSFEATFKDMAKPEEGLGDFRPSEPIDDYQSGAKTHSENEFRLEALNDRGMYDYITANRDRLYRKANVDPEGAIRDIVSRAKGRYSIEPKNIRKDWAMKVLNSFYEDEKAPDLSKPAEFKPSDKLEQYDDTYNAQTISERDLNVGTANDEGAYNYINNHKEALLKEAQYDPESVLRKIALHADHWDYFSRVKADSVRPDYLLKVISGINPED